MNGAAVAMDVAPYFVDPNGDPLTYSAVSSNAAVVTTSVSGSTVMLSPVSAGAATATVTAMDLGGLTATQSVAVTVDLGDAHGNTRDAAMPIGSVSDTGASLDTQGDVDYFSLDISELAALTAETTGGTDTFGQLESEDGLVIASADGGGSGGNFRIERQVPAATYYVRISGATRTVTGPYMLLVRTSDATPPGPRSQGAPDLTVYAVSVATNPSGTSPGGSFTLSAGVRNDGDAASAATTLRYYRSTDATITTADTSVGTDAVGGLAVAATISESIDLTAPSAAGTYYYGACVEAVAGESDATNNCSPSVQVSVTEVRAETHPDLAVGSPSVSDSSPTSGATFSLSAAVRNDGDGAAAATTLHYYRSTDATITTADTSVGTDAVGGLAAGATGPESIDLTAPSAPGTYYYGACVDAVTGESDTTNNCSGSVQVTVSAPPPSGPDLTIYAIVAATSPDGTRPGGTFRLNVGVRNDGDESSAATTLRYYRSTDTTITTSDTEVGTDTVGVLSAEATTSTMSVTVTAPSSAGTYRYGACVDTVTGESDTTNNCSGSVSVVVSESPPQTNPDLAVGSPTVSDNSPTTGATFTLSATVRNDGDGPSAATTLRYYRSPDATITSSDTEVGTDAVGGLAAGATGPESISLTAPSTAGTYYYGACVDEVTDESDATNNCSSAVSVIVSAPPPQTNPDLEVQSPSVNDSSLDTGASFTLSATVRNDGDGGAAATTLRYYRSTDGTITTSDTEVGTDAVGGLSAGATSPESISLTAPSTADTYYYGACVDEVTDESDTTNNCSSAVSVTVSASPPPPPPQTNPDLEVQSPSVNDNSLDTGASFTLSATVRNDGDGGAAATTLRYYRSTDTTITTSDTEVGTDTVGGLAAGATSPESISLTAPSTADTYYYGACVDEVTDESDTTNNCSSAVSVTVSASPPPPPPQTNPDLEVQSPSVNDNSLDTGASFTLSATVRNDGDGGAAATTLRYYRSTDTTITTSDTEVGTDTVGGLAAGATSPESISLTAPSTADTYYYGACVDEVTDESDTTNNCSSAVSVTVSASPPPPPPQTNPDLEVQSPSVNDNSLDTGASFTLSATVRNDGDGGAAATTLRYYRSTDTTITTSDTEVGTDTVGGLAAGATSPESISLTAPSSAGTYYYGACVDTVTGESDTTNNCSSAVSVTVVVQETQPDLTLTLSITPPSGGIFHVGSSFRVGATVLNSGEAASDPTTLRYYLSKDAPIRTSDTEVGTDAVGALSASGASAESIDLTAPDSAGTYYYNACVDAVASESNTTNNCSFVSIGVTVVPEADLVVGSLSVTDSSPETGESFTLSATVRNDGDGAVAATTLRYYRSTDATITSSDTSVGTDWVRGLSAGATSPESISLTAPSSAGTYYYGACVDAVTGESDTTNNCSGSVSVDVQEP